MSKPKLLYFRNSGDFFNWLVTVALILLTLSFFGFLLFESLTFIKAPAVWDGFFSTQWFPSENSFGFLPLLAGSLISTGVSVLFSFPIAVAIVVTIVLNQKRLLGEFLLNFTELMQGLPSIVVGLWGLTVVVPFIAARSPSGSGTSLLAAIVILTIMITPSMILAILPALQSRFNQNILAAKALHLSSPTYMIRVVIPDSAKAFASASILGAGRSLGETMAVLLVCGNIVNIPSSVFDPIRTVNTNIALEMAYAQDIHRSSLFFGGLVLLSVVLGLFLFIRRIES